MGWASGSEILERVAKLVMPKIQEKDRPSVAKKLIAIFEDEDCDTINEVEQRDVARAYEKMHPDCDD